MPTPRELFAQREWIAELAQGLLGDSSVADEVAQEAWLLLQKGESEGVSRPRAWVRAVIANLARSRRRAEARRRAREARSARAEALPAADELLQRAELQRALAEEVLALSEPERGVVLQRYFDGLSSAEIARASGQPAATVRAQLARGLAHLRSRLDRRGGRETWAPALVGLARSIRPEWMLPLVPAGSAPAAPSASPSLTGAAASPAAASLPLATGALAMKALVAAGLAVALAATATVAFLWRDAPSSASERPVAAVATPEPRRTPSAAPADAGAATALATSDEPSARSGLSAPAAAAPAAQVDAAETAFACRFELRTVDARGRPLEGVAVRFEARPDGEGPGDLAPAGPGETSAADGSVALVRAGRGSSATVRLAARREGYATAWIDALWVQGGDVALGELVLLDAARVVGRVVDEAGAPLADVELAATGAELEGFDVEQARRHGPDAALPLPTCTSGADGRFTLEDVPVGAQRVWAGAEGFAWTWSEPVTLESGRVRDVGELVLRSLRGDDRITGIVLDPDGAPVPGAPLALWFQFANYGETGNAECDAEGRFEIVVKERAPYDIRASDPKGRWASVGRTAVEPGTHGLELQFQPARWIQLALVDPEGAPVEAAAIQTRDVEEDGTELYTWVRERKHADGKARILVPNDPFRLHVQARGYAAWIGAALDPEEAPEDLRIELVPLPGIRGQVVGTAGKPVAGVRVGLHTVYSPAQLVHVNGFRTLTGENGDDEATSDSEGRFVLYAPRSGEYLVRAERKGFAPSESRRFQAAPGTLLEDVAVQLLVGGAIEGHVIVPGGVDPSGVILGLNRGDGSPRTLRVDREGSYRIEGLTPGPWQLVPWPEELTAGYGSQSFSSTDEDHPFDGWTCNVVDGQTTRYDVRAGGAEGLALVGRLTLDGALAAGWTAQLGDVSFSQLSPPSVASTTLASDGSFRLEPTAPGTYRLTLLAPESGSGRLQLIEEVTLSEGEREWSLQLAFGRIEGTGAVVGAGSERPLYLEWRSNEDGHALEARIRILADASGRFSLPLVPSGDVSIVTYGVTQGGQNPLHPVVLKRLTLAPGALESVALEP